MFLIGAYFGKESWFVKIWAVMGCFLGYVVVSSVSLLKLLQQGLNIQSRSLYKSLFPAANRELRR